MWMKLVMLIWFIKAYWIYISMKPGIRSSISNILPNCFVDMYKREIGR